MANLATQTDSRTGHPAQGDIPALTGLRFVAAMMVLLGHGYRVVPFENATILGEIFLPMSEIAMTLFFTLSGFVMWFNYAGSFRRQGFSAALWQFCAARFARLYPLYLLVLILGIAIAGTKVFFGGFPESLLYGPLAQAWTPGHDDRLLVYVLKDIAHTWSISTEAFLYLAFPLVVLWLPRVKTAWTLQWLIGIAVALFTAAHFAAAFWTGPVAAFVAPAMLQDNGYKWLTYYSPYFHLAEFVGGCFLARLYQAARKRPGGVRAPSWEGLMSTGAVLALVGVGYTYSMEIPHGWRTPIYTMRAGAALLATIILISNACLYTTGWLSRLLSWRPVVAGGELSYSLYMLHPFTLAPFGKEAQMDLTPAGLGLWFVVLFGATAATIVVSWLSYRLIEAPSRRSLRRALARLSPGEGLPFVGLWLVLIAGIIIAGALI